MDRVRKQRGPPSSSQPLEPRGQPGRHGAEFHQSETSPQALDSSGPSSPGAQCPRQTPASTPWPQPLGSVSHLSSVPFPSGVQRYHQVLREGETAETLPTQPVQISLLWDLWQSVKTGPREELHPGHTEDSRHHLGQNLSFLGLFIYCPLPAPTTHALVRPPPPTPDVRASACPLSLLAGGQDVGERQGKGSKGGCGADAFPSPGPRQTKQEASTAPGDSREAGPRADERQAGRVTASGKPRCRLGTTSCVFPGSTLSTQECPAALCPPASA